MASPTMVIVFACSRSTVVQTSSGSTRRGVVGEDQRGSLGHEHEAGPLGGAVHQRGQDQQLSGTPPPAALGQSW